MKNLSLLIILSFLSSYALKAQVMHGSNAMEYRIGAERFSQFVVDEADSLILSSSQLSPEVFRWRPTLTTQYKKFREEGDYFAFGINVGYSSWLEEMLVENSIDFTPSGDPILFSSFELNKEVQFGLSYQYSFLINKENEGNFQFFIGGEASLNSSFASKDGLRFAFFSRLNRNITGGRISAVPEILYLLPNSRVSFSLRAVVPFANLQRVREELSVSTFSSFSQSIAVSNDFQLVPVGFSRFEIGFGYFLKSL